MGRITGSLGALFILSIAAHSQPVLSRNFIPNGSFENGLRGWERVWGRTSVTDDAAHDGTYALYIKDGGAVSTPMAAFQLGPLYYSGWVKTHDIVVGANPYNVAVVQVAVYGEDQKALRHWDVFQAKGTNDWQRFEGTLDLSGERDAETVKLSCQIWNTTGEAWFDDLTLGPPYEGPSPREETTCTVNEAKPFSEPGSPPIIIPHPQQVAWLDGEFLIDAETPLLVEEGIWKETSRAVEIWKELLDERYEVDLAAPSVLEEGWKVRSVHLCSTKRFLREAPAGWPQKRKDRTRGWRKYPGPEGYLLSVSPRFVVLAADDAAGFLHGMQTLRQLLSPVRHGLGRLSAVQIRDWPDLGWRGMYLSMCYGPGAGAGCDVPLLKRIIRDVLAGYKLNALILQVDNNMRYQSHPELGGAFSPDDMRGLVDFCDRYGIEVIPLIQSFGHNHYFAFAGGKLHRDLAEDDSTYSVCPSNPDSVQFFTDIYDEIIDAFHPRYIHIGCDEVGPIGVCEKCKNTPKAELFAKHVNALRDHLHERGVGTMIWGDYLLDPEAFPGSSYCHGAETWQALNLLRKDIVICDWHYRAGVGPGHEYPTTKALHDHGFPVIAVPAVYSRLNNATYAQYVRRVGLDSLFSSVWASVHNWKGVKGHPDYMGGMVHAAEYAWTTPLPSLSAPSPYSAEEVALERLRPATRPGQKGFLVELKAQANTGLELGPDFPFGRHVLGGTRFRILDPLDTGGRWCLGVGGGTDLPKVVSDVAIGRKAKSLIFLHACQPAKDAQWEAWRTLGQVEILYEDNEVALFPIVSDLTVAPVHRSRPKLVYGAKEIEVPGNQVLYASEWINPAPDRVIHHLNLVSSPEGGADLFLLALTGVDAETTDEKIDLNPVPNTAQTWIEGFSEIVDSSHRDAYFTYRGESTLSWYEYPTTGEERLMWRTAPLPLELPEDRVTFVVACGLGSGAGDCPHDIYVNGKKLLTIGTPDATDAQWSGENACAFFDYVIHDPWDSFGVLYLTIPVELLVPGKKSEIEVRGSASGKKSWFMIHDYRDTLQYNQLRFGRGLLEEE